MKKSESVDAYIAGFPPAARKQLKKLRAIVRKAAPEAVETISYGMPAFKLNGMLVWFAAHRNHIGFYPKSTVIAALRKDLTAYKVSKGTVQFPLDQPLPLGLIARIVRTGVAENAQRAKRKK